MTAILVSALLLGAPPATADGEAPSRAALYVCCEPVVLAKVLEVKVKGDGFVPVPVPPSDTPTPSQGTPSPADLLAKFPLGMHEPEREMRPSYTANLRVQVLKVESDRKGAYPMVQVGDELSLTHEGLLAQPDYHPQSVVRLSLRLHADQRDPRKASYSVWQLVSASPALSERLEADAPPPIHVGSDGGEMAQKSLYVREFLKAIKTWKLYDGLTVPNVGKIAFNESGGTFTCLTGGEPVRRGVLDCGGDTADAMALHEFANHDKDSLTPAMVEKLYATWKYLRAKGEIADR